MTLPLSSNPDRSTTNSYSQFLHINLTPFHSLSSCANLSASVDPTTRLTIEKQQPSSLSRSFHPFTWSKFLASYKLLGLITVERNLTVLFRFPMFRTDLVNKLYRSCLSYKRMIHYASLQETIPSPFAILEGPNPNMRMFISKLFHRKLSVEDVIDIKSDIYTDP